MPSMRASRLAAVAVLLAALPAATAVAADYRSYGLSSTAAVPGISGSTTFVRSRVIVPRAWTRLSAPAGTLRFREGNRLCVFTVSFSLRTRVGPEPTPAERVTADLPVQAPGYVIDSGTRAPGAWRVTRDPTVNRQITVHGEYARRAHADPGLVPAGQVAWTTINAIARSRPGDECHSGAYRDNLGPTLGDAFATTRTTAYVRRAM